MTVFVSVWQPGGVRISYGRRSDTAGLASAVNIGACSPKTPFVYTLPGKEEVSYDTHRKVLYIYTALPPGYHTHTQSHPRCYTRLRQQRTVLWED